VGATPKPFSVSAKGGGDGFRAVAFRTSRGEVFFVAVSLHDTTATFRNVLAVEGAASLAVLAALALVAWFVLHLGVRPLDQMAVTADAIAAGDLSRRVERAEPSTEAGRLGLALNTMLGEIEDAFAERSASEERLRRFVADASHELRTPLTTIQGNAGLLARGPAVSDDVRRAAAKDIAAESARMARLVDRMLTLARADSGLRLGLTDVVLNEIVAEVCRQAASVHAGIELRLDAAEVAVRGDPDGLRQLLWVLLDNAFRYARHEVTVLVRAESGWARLTVADDGPGIQVQDRDRVFERFYRADTSRTGGHAGLGLSIARWLVDQHGGRIIAGESVTDGCAILVDLPLLSSS